MVMVPPVVQSKLLFTIRLGKDNFHEHPSSSSIFLFWAYHQFQIEVMVPPAVQSKPREGLIVTRKGQDVTLRCSGRGNPNPRITWSKKVKSIVWYFVIKIVLTYCEKKILEWSRKTFEIRGWRPRIFQNFWDFGSGMLF